MSVRRLRRWYRRVSISAGGERPDINAGGRMELRRLEVASKRQTVLVEVFVALPPHRGVEALRRDVRDLRRQLQSHGAGGTAEIRRGSQQQSTRAAATCSRRDEQVIENVDARGPDG